jgi:chromosomal replication initiation ATPase DnaA
VTAEQLALDFGARPALGAEDFLPAPCNAAALAWLAGERRWSAAALVLYGPAGCGKSHLARLWAERERARCLLPEALEIAALPGLIAEHPALVLDPAQAVAGDHARERALFHLFNLAAAEGRRLLLTGREPPAAWGLGLADLRSRLLAAPAVGIGAPDEAVLAALLVKALAERQLEPPAELVAYLVPRMERSFAAVGRLAAALDRTALARRRPLSVALAREVLAAIEDNTS